MDNNNLLSITANAQAPVAPVADQESTSKSYFVPMVWHRHTEVALCSHQHDSLESASQCLDSKKLAFDEVLKDPNLTKRLKRYYQNTIFAVREVVFKKSWAMHSQFDHCNGEVKDHWQNHYIDLQYLPIFGFCPDSLPLSELIEVINVYHDQPQRRSKNRPKATKVVSLNEFISYKTPSYLKEAQHTLASPVTSTEVAPAS